MRVARQFNFAIRGNSSKHMVGKAFGGRDPNILTAAGTTGYARMIAGRADRGDLD